MSARHCIRRLVKWFATLTFPVLFAAFLTSVGRSIEWASSSHRYHVELTHGSIRLCWPSAAWSEKAASGEKSGWTVGTYADQTWNWDWFERSGNALYEWLHIPIWVLLAVCAGLGAVLWYADREQSAAALRRFVERLRAKAHSAPRRTATWALTGLAGFILTMFSLSLPWSFVLQGTSQTYILSRGRVSWFSIGSRDSFPGARIETGIHSNPNWNPQFDVEVFTHGGAAIPITSYIVIPLWLPFVLIAAPAAILIWISRHPLSGHCPRCNYNLTANTSGRCPECGMPTERAP